MTAAKQSRAAGEVLVFCEFFEPGYKGGGPIRSMAHILDSVSEELRLTLVTSDRDLGDRQPYPGLSGCRVSRGHHRVLYWNRNSVAQTVSLYRTLFKREFDLMYVNSLWSPRFSVVPLILWKLGLLHAGKVLLAPRGELTPGALSLKHRKKKAVLPLLHRVLRSIDPTWHASSAQEAQQIRDQFSWARTVTQAPGAGPVARESIESSGTKARFIFISRISRMKNLRTAIAALAEINHVAVMDVYGPIEDMSYWAECEALISALPSHVTVTYCGELPHDKVQDTFAAYDAFILPTHGENFGHAIAESLSAGCPVLCSDRTPWTGVLIDGGGWALRLETSVWTAQIERLAAMSADERLAKKVRALEAYRRWQASAKPRTAVEIMLENRSPRIAIVTQGYQSAGGVQTVARWLVDGLREHFDVHVFDLASSRRDPISRRLLWPPSWLRQSLFRASATESSVTHIGANAVELELMRYRPRRELSKALEKFDIVQVVAGGPALARAVLGVRRPVVLQVATTVKWERLPKTRRSSFRTPLDIWRSWMTRCTSRTERFALRSVNAVLVENRQMAEYVQSLGQESVVLAPPGVDTNRFTPADVGWQRYGYLLSVCRLSDPRKGLERLVAAYARLVRNVADVPNLVLAGRGQMPSHIWEQLDALGIRARVEVLRDVPYDILPGLYRGASVYLQTSHEEGLGISVLEAMSCGLPVVSTATAGTLETVEDGVTGWLVNQTEESQVVNDVADRAARVLERDGRAMSRRARERAVQRFSLDVTLSRFISAYGQAVPSE